MIVKVAILDTGIDDWLVNSSNEINIPNIVKGNSTQHGTNCYLILNKYIIDEKVSIKSICILNNDGSGLIENLKSALNLCLENNINVVNLSFGTINFKDYEKVRKVINEYYHKGIIFVASTSNEGFTSYPSSLSTVIGVQAKESNSIIKLEENNIHLGIDFIAPSIHKLNIFDLEIITLASNSYATPYITSKIVNLLNKNKNLTFNEIKCY